MIDQPFFYDSPINDLTAGQRSKAIIRSTWPESDKEIYEHELEKRYESTGKTNKRPH